MPTPITLSIAAQGAGSSAGPTFLAYLDTWIIGGLVLLVVVVVTLKWAWGRIRSARQPRDDYDYYYYDDDYDDDDYRASR